MTATKRKNGARLYECELCGRKAGAYRMIYSKHTGWRYCRDFDGCDRRRRKEGRL